MIVTGRLLPRVWWNAILHDKFFLSCTEIHQNLLDNHFFISTEKNDIGGKEKC